MSANPSISPIITQFQLQTRLFNNCLEGFNKEYNKQPNATTNHAAWLAGHILFARTNMANLLGMNLPNPYDKLYANFKPLETGATYPEVPDVTKNWDELSNKFLAKLDGLTEDVLNSASPIQLPVSDGTMRGTLAFFAHHEAYHIGQLGLVRRYHGYDGMKY